MRRQSSSLATLATATRRSAAIAGVLRCSVNATTCSRGGIATMLATSPTTSARRGVATDFSHYPRDVGIVALDVYFPSTYVSQSDLGTHSISLIFAHLPHLFAFHFCEFIFFYFVFFIL
jgi:hypothetical protein